MYERGGSTVLSFQHPLGALEQTLMPAVAVCLSVCVCREQALRARSHASVYAVADRKGTSGRFLTLKSHPEHDAHGK